MFRFNKSKPTQVRDAVIKFIADSNSLKLFDTKPPTNYSTKLYSSQYPTGPKQTGEIAELFHSFHVNNDHKIIQDVLKSTCRVSKQTLYVDIISNLSHESNQNKLQSKLQAINDILSDYTQDEIEKESHLMPMIEGLTIERSKLEMKLKQIDESNEQKSHLKLDYDGYHNKALKIGSKVFKKMKESHLGLSYDEVLSILLYCDEDFFCYKLRKAQRDRMKTCLWRSLDENIRSGIKKLHSAMHERNDKFLKKSTVTHLLHGTSVQSLSITQQKKLELNTITSFSREWSVAHTFAKPNGLILVIENVKQALYDGTLIGADVSWMSAFQGEGEFIILHSEFENIREIHHDERMDNGWCIPDDHKMYMMSPPRKKPLFYCS